MRSVECADGRLQLEAQRRESCVEEALALLKGSMVGPRHFVTDSSTHFDPNENFLVRTVACSRKSFIYDYRTRKFPLLLPE